jgi:hypothetical protein
VFSILTHIVHENSTGISVRKLHNGKLNLQLSKLNLQMQLQDPISILDKHKNAAVRVSFGLKTQIGFRPVAIVLKNDFGHGLIRARR